MENRKFIHSKNGEPTELYLVLMRIGGVFFDYLFSWYDYISNYKIETPL